MNNLQEVTKNLSKKNVPNLRAGQVVRVHERIKEGDKERVQVFEGLVIAVKHGSGLSGTFTVRKIGAGGVGVERIFPLHMPAIEKIEILRQEKVRRAKLYYIRGQVGKKTKKRKTKLQNLIFDMGGTEISEPSPTSRDEVEAGGQETENSEQLKEETSEIQEESKTEDTAAEEAENKEEEKAEEPKDLSSEALAKEEESKEETKDKKEGEMEDTK